MRSARVMTLLFLTALSAGMASPLVYSQSLTASTWQPLSPLSRPKAVGFQNAGFMLQYVAPQGRDWQSILKQESPGYIERVAYQVAMMQEPSHDEIEPFADWPVQIIVLYSGNKQLVTPEGFFCEVIAAELHPSDGDVLLRMPWSEFLERTEPDYHNSMIRVQISTSFGRAVRQIPWERARSVSQLLHTLSTASENADSFAGLDLQLPYVWIERYEPGMGHTCFLFRSNGPDQADSFYEDTFHNLALRPSDRLTLGNTPHIRDLLQLWDSGRTGLRDTTPGADDLRFHPCLRISPLQRVHGASTNPLSQRNPVAIRRKNK